MVKFGANDNSFNLININIDGTNIAETPLVKAANGIFNKVFSRAIEYQIVREAELKKLASDTNKYFNLIPENDRDDSKLGLTLKDMEDSQYQVTDKELRDMFARLIAKTMDKRINSDIPPAFSDILKNLSSNEAIICKILYKSKDKVLPLFDLKILSPSTILHTLYLAINSSISLMSYFGRLFSPNMITFNPFFTHSLIVPADVPV